MANHEELIQTSLRKQLDAESFAKLWQVLGSIGKNIIEPLLYKYNRNLLCKIRQPQKLNFPDNYRDVTHASLLIHFYSFRFIYRIGKHLIEVQSRGDEKSEQNFTTLLKVLLHHALVAKSYTAEFALVELEQLSRACKLTLPQVYEKYRNKFLRSIIKGILQKLEGHGPQCFRVGINGNRNPGLSNNCVITYMTRAFDVFDISMITLDDIAQSLIIVTNLIHKDKYTMEIRQFINHLASYQNIDQCTLIRSHIETIMINLLLRRKMSQFDIDASLKKLCSFFGKVPKDVLMAKFTNIKGSLLLHYHTNSKLVTDSIYYLSQYEKDEMDQPFEDDFNDEKVFIDYLKPSLIGVLLGVDAQFRLKARLSSASDITNQVKSLSKLITKLDDETIQTIHHKLLSTASLIVRLRPERMNDSLNSAIVALWDVFLMKLDQERKNSLIVNISVALYDFIEDCPEEVCRIYNDLIMPCQKTTLQNGKANKDKSHKSTERGNMKTRLGCLFFIPNANGFESLNEYLKPYVQHEPDSSDFQQFCSLVDRTLPLMKYENQKCHHIAVARLRDLLKSNQNLLVSNMLVNLDEPLNGTILKTIEALLAVSSTQNQELSALIAECLGILGAVNPMRLDHFIYGGVCESKMTNFSVTDNKFIVELIERLKNSLFSDRVSESESANYAIQVVLKEYEKHLRDIMQSLSADAKQACQLCKDTNYMGTQRVVPDSTIPIYTKFKNDCQYSYKDWLDKFTLLLVSAITDPKAREVLHACSYTFKHNVKMAEFILPSVIIHIILNTDNTDIIRREIMAIVNEDVGLSSQGVDTVYSDEVRNNLQTLHFQCANMVFCVLDTLNRAEKLCWESREPILRAHIQQLQHFIGSLEKDKIAILAYKCRAYARALYYFEQFYSQKKCWPFAKEAQQQQQQQSVNGMDKYWTELQKVYMALDEPFEAAEIEALRKSYTSLRDDIANYEALAKFDKAFVCYDALLDTLDERMDRKSIFEDSLRCLSNQGDFQRLYERSQQLMQAYPNYRRSLLPAATEALWKLGRWDELDHLAKSEDLTSRLDSASVSKGFLITSLKEKRPVITKRLSQVRSSLMKPLSIAMIDRSVYFRGYQNLLVLHEIEDYELTLEMLEDYMKDQQIDENSTDQLRINLTTRLVSLLQSWSDRNRLVEPTIKSLEPLISWQRAITQTITNKYPFIQPQINIDIGQMWLTSATVARESRCYDRSFSCLIQAQKYFGPETLNINLDLRVKLAVEHAKLDWDQGESTKAIRGLKAALDKLSKHELLKHLELRRVNVIEESRKRIPTEVTIDDPYPDLDGDSCKECEKFLTTERECFSKLLVLLTKYSEDAAADTPKALLGMYDQCVHLGVNQEETLLLLARYYDKLATHYNENPNALRPPSNQELEKMYGRLSSQEKLKRRAEFKTEITTKLMEQSILAFGNSLKWGIQHLSESMPRMLNIWFDMGAKKNLTSSQRIDPNVTSRRSSTGVSSPPRWLTSRIDNVNRFLDTLFPEKEKASRLPSYYNFSALSLLLSRVNHPHPVINAKTIKILEQLTVDYPHQMIWYLQALENDLINERKVAAATVTKNASKRNPKLDKIFNDNRALSRSLIAISEYATEADKGVGKKKLGSEVHVEEIDSSIKNYRFGTMSTIVPVHASMRPVIPTQTDFENLECYNVFPEHYMTFVSQLQTKCKVFQSLQQPKQVDFLCRSGRKVSVLCKQGDDLRKDSRCTEFFDLYNKILRRKCQASARFFGVPTFLVLPLKSTVGIIEMLANLETVRSIIQDGYIRTRGKQFQMAEGLKKRNRKSDATDQEVYKVFVRAALPRVTPPVLQDVLKSRFVETTSWYTARLAYVRSTAAVSMAGFIIGLGDRHLDNILFDSLSGRIVHVDFNLVFHQGETLMIPEIVPFRLTQNIVAALGPTEKEGNFRKYCEIAMRVMRSEKELLLTTLKPFLHDPCVDWEKQREQGNKADKQKPTEDITGNQIAIERIKVVEDKLKGFPRTSVQRPLNAFSQHSVESQVHILIEEATDLWNLAQMYHGWNAHL